MQLKAQQCIIPIRAISAIRGYLFLPPRPSPRPCPRVAFCGGREVRVVAVGDFSTQVRLGLSVIARGVAFHGTDELVIVDNEATIRLYDLRSGVFIHSAPHVPLCGGADLRGATGLDKATRKALKDAGAQV